MSRRLAPWIALLLAPVLVIGPSSVPSAATPEAPQRSVDGLCAAPTTHPALSIRDAAPRHADLTDDEMAVARDIAAVGHRARVPARAQAIALMAAWSTSGLSADDPRFLFTDPLPGGEGDEDGGMTTEEFYAALTGVRGWRSLPPGIAAHRAVGDADPYRHEDYWDAAVSLLGRLAADPRIDPATAVSTGARSDRRCAPAAPGGVGMPVPAGSAYRLERGPAKGPATSPMRVGRDGAEIRTHCGTPVLSAAAGSVTLRRKAGSDSGPWRLGVRNRAAGITIWYHHVLAPTVEDGQSVAAGTQLAEVGGLGATDSCSLGVSVWQQTERKQGQKTARKKGQKTGQKVGQKTGRKKDHERARKQTQKPLDTVAWLRSNARPGVLLVRPERPRKKRVKAEIPATTMRVASYNVLGAHLTGRGSSKPHYGPGADRMRAGIALLESSGIEIVALNEFEGPQAAVFGADPDWDLHRATGNSPLRGGDYSGNAIAWRSDAWQLVRAEDEVIVPWQVTLHMPVLRLRNVETGRQILVMAIHNPASTKRQGNQQSARDRARGIELAAVRTLTESLDLPILVMGDMNERDAVFCHFTGAGDLEAAAGGSVGGTCRPPDYGGVDWIFGSPELVFSQFAVNRSTLGRISDHALVTSTVVVPAG